MNIISKVNILQGCDSTRDFSTGNTLPLIARPWGPHHWSPQTVEGAWFFHPRHRKLWGLRLTHQPSPWMEDYAPLTISAFTGGFLEKMSDQSSAWRIEEAVLQPNYFRADLLRYGIRLEMAPTDHGAHFSFTRRGQEPLRVRFHVDGAHELDGATGEVRGISRKNRGGVAGDFGLRFFGRFSVPPESFTRAADGGYFTFPQSAETVRLTLASSFISPEIAQAAHDRELAASSLVEAAAEGERIWNDLLSRIQISAESERQERTFYSCLYRCLLFPRFADEIGLEGEVLHYSPYDGAIHPGPLCAGNGFWDTHRTVYPLLALAYPDILTRMMEGWLSACREAGWSPRWSSPGAHDCMVGSFFDAVVADAVAKGVTDWDVEGAFAFLWKNASVPSTDPGFGRRALGEYLELGYVPTDRRPYAVSRTLDYCYNDFCVKQVANFLGKTEEAAQLAARLGNYRNVFDPEIGFMRARLADGSWAPFSEFAWGGPYIEGGPWQHSFNVPYDPEGLAALWGGPDALCAKLDAMFTTPPYFEASHYGSEIHEMTEMALVDFGQYAHSNQPVHHCLFLYARLGQVEKTEYWVGRVARELYTPDAFPGDEDNGEMSAWYVLATLGLYPLCPGAPEYVCFRPLVAEAAIRAPGAEAPIRLYQDRSTPRPTMVTRQELLERKGV